MDTYYINKLAETIEESGYDAMLVAPGAEFKFLLGMSPMFCERFQGLFVKKDGGLFYICNLLYADEARASLPENIRIYPWFDGDVMTDVVEKALSEQGLIGGVIGVASTARAFNILEIMDKVDVTFKNGKPLMEKVRIIKSHKELDALRESAEVADRVFEDVIRIIRPGLTEGEIGDFLLKRMTELGGRSVWCIVAAGANAAYPHYCGKDHVVQEKDIVLMDYGCTVHGMYSDMTRTVFIGEPTKREREIYELVRRSNEEAEKLVKEGAWIPDIEQKARDVLDEQGYAKTLINRLGHGVGYTIHEAPDIKQSNPMHLARGMAFSIEPGIYLDGEIGVRIEDVVIVNEDGDGEVLNQVSKELIVL